jgi:hypothetical protein
LVVDGPFHGVYLRMLAKCIWKGEIMQQSIYEMFKILLCRLTPYI